MHGIVVQAWVVKSDTGPGWLVYRQSIALDKLSLPGSTEMVSRVIVRWADGSRSYVDGGVASAVAEYLRSQGHDVVDNSVA